MLPNMPETYALRSEFSKEESKQADDCQRADPVSSQTQRAVNQAAHARQRRIVQAPVQKVIISRVSVPARTREGVTRDTWNKQKTQPKGRSTQTECALTSHEWASLP
jgi:hypothetical protein